MFETKHTTKIEPSQTAGEISSILSQVGATDIHIKYDNGELCGLLFDIEIKGTPTKFKMPVDWKPLFEHKCQEKQDKARQALQKGWELPIRAQARRTAWRVALEWLKVQLYMIELGMKTVQQVFLSDMMTPDGKSTLGELLESGKLGTLLLEMKD